MVPEAVLELLTWQELETRVCGDPEITIDALKKTSELSASLSFDVGVSVCGVFRPDVCIVAVFILHFEGKTAMYVCVCVSLCVCVCFALAF